MTAHTPITGWLTPEDYAAVLRIIGTVRTVRQIAAEVSAITGIPVGAILCKRRTPARAVAARWLVWDIAHRGGLSLPQIARVTGHDHTSVWHGVHRIREMRGEE